MKNLKQLQDLAVDLVQNTSFTENRFPDTLYAPVDYFMHLGGKRLRPTLLLAATQCFGGDIAQAKPVALGVELFHNFTLLHDDLIDRSPLRRGKPTVYHLYGETSAILTGDAAFSMAVEQMVKCPAVAMPDVMKDFATIAVLLHQGVQMDMDFEQRIEVPFDDYMLMIRLKTGELLAGAMRMGAHLAQATPEQCEAIYQYGIHLGLAFQLQDDLLDIFADPETWGKPIGQDIRENKKTIFYILALQSANAQQREQLLRYFNSKEREDLTEAQSEQKVKEVIALFDELRTADRINQMIADEFAQAHAALDTLQSGCAPEALQPFRDMISLMDGRKK